MDEFLNFPSVKLLKVRERRKSKGRLSVRQSASETNGRVKIMVNLLHLGVGQHERQLELSFTHKSVHYNYQNIDICEENAVLLIL